MESRHPTLFFDLDGTLVRCHEYYSAVVDEFAETAARRTGVEYTTIRTFAKDIDLLAALRSTQYSKERFPAALAATSVMADVLAGNEPNWEAAHQAAQLGHRVYHAPYLAYPGVVELLTHYQQGGWQLVLLTKGDDTVQLRKIHRAGLDAVFTPDRLAIVRRKDALNLASLLQWYGADARSWVIGDSLRDDIVPAQSLGVNTAYIDSREAWAYDRSDVLPPTCVIGSVLELPAYIGFSS